MHFSKRSLGALALAVSVGKVSAFQTHTRSESGPRHIAAFISKDKIQQSIVRKSNISGVSTFQMSISAENAEVKTPLEEISPSYKELVSKLQTITQLRRCSAVLDYDRMVLMPSSDDAAASRGAQQSALASIIHEKATDSSISGLIEKVHNDLMSADINSSQFEDERRVLELTKISFEKNERIPAELEAKRAALGSSAYTAWVKARSASDFSMFAPTLKECFDTAKAIANYHRGGDTSVPLYTQMLDEFEMGMKAERIDDIFGEIQQALVPLISKVLASESPPSMDALHGTFDIEKQKDVNKEIITKMGFDIDSGRIDESVHPFTMSFSPSDVRITSRFSTDEWYQGLAATIHEGGHAMYEQNIGGSCLDIDSYLSMGAHESQSLFWERHIGMTKEFCKWTSAKLGSALSGEGSDFDYSADDIYGAINAVSPSEIRVEADELTYPLHVILRYNIEKDVVEGRMEVDDIPQRWNEAMKSMLDVEITDDAKGCLQDVHWSGLAIGYFPTYLIGSATAAQLAYYCEKDVPNFHDDIANGEFENIKNWLTEKVHKHGRRYESLDAMLEDQLGEPLNPSYLINYLTS
eukprot:CAMPEP_0194123872 /NCGR_PEP_ID=MMETSP0150-20130528/56333_1 /TAXON_ID=122233 /ORGANISM="Chaetoceros debilis, Strain MM31A-1" /LENGTH=581 /DNA_ID=CAMNT_0038817325 /DNA_START=55 /DNA_END=1797 /DNA_ORIENTATION=+